MLLNAGVFNILTCKCASRHSGVQFFDIKPPKSGPYPSVFPHFDWQICFAPQRRAIFQRRNFQNGSAHVVFSTFWLTNMLRATAACHFWTSELPKWLRPCGVFHILTYKYASRHSGVQFLNIRTSKMAPRMWCFEHFDLQMCFPLQRRAIFEHQNFQNGSANVVFWAFWLANVLRATAACNFWFEHQNFQNGSANVVFWAFWLANVLRATAACHFSPVCQNSYLRTRRFSEATFLTSATTTHWKNTAIRDVSNIFRACWTPCYWLYTHVDLVATESTRMLLFWRLTLHTCWSSCYWHDCCATLLFNSTYCRKLDF